MHLLLTDRLTCPRCGPSFGLILLADRLEERRVLEGTFGCPNCRDQLPVHAGFGDLRAPPRGAPPEGRVGDPDVRPEDAGEAERLLALVGVTQGPGTIVLVGAPARHARSFVERIEGIHVVGSDSDLVDWPDATGVSRMMAGDAIPLHSRSMRGAAVDGRMGAKVVEEAARVVAPRGRVVVVHAEEEAVATILRGAGLQVLASEGGTVVAARP
jgi:hypothetical protein